MSSFVCWYVTILQITTKISDRCDIRASNMFQARHILYTASNSTQSDFCGPSRCPGSPYPQSLCHSGLICVSYRQISTKQRRDDYRVLYLSSLISISGFVNGCTYIHIQIPYLPDLSMPPRSGFGPTSTAI